MAFSREQLTTYEGATLPDLLPPTTRLLFVGINPGLLTVAVQAHFAPRGNRSFPALFHAGLTDRLIDASGGMRGDDLLHLRRRGIGITSLVAAATAKASELSAEQLRAGASELRSKVTAIEPSLVAFLGISSYRIAFERPRAQVGRQADVLEGIASWVVPNPSGLNFHASLADLAAAYREVGVAAGIEPFDRSVGGPL